MSLGLLATLAADIPIALTLIDHDQAALAIATAAIRDLATRRTGPVTITTRAEDTGTTLPAADLVVLGTLLNELPADARLATVDRALASIGDDGAVLVIEPALRDTARALHAVRDAILARGGHVFAPCTRAAAPCPALADPDDWCHEDRPVTLPRRTAELARLTHLRDGGLKFAYLVLRKHELHVADAGWRIVSAPMPAKGKLELIGCSDRGRIPLRLLRRHRDEGNRDFERADRGDVVVLDPEPDPEGGRVEIRRGVRISRT